MISLLSRTGKILACDEQLHIHNGRPNMGGQARGLGKGRKDGGRERVVSDD